MDSFQELEYLLKIKEMGAGNSYRDPINADSALFHQKEETEKKFKAEVVLNIELASVNKHGKYIENVLYEGKAGQAIENALVLAFTKEIDRRIKLLREQIKGKLVLEVLTEKPYIEDNIEGGGDTR